jgi:hypothetical protein
LNILCILLLISSVHLKKLPIKYRFCFDVLLQFVCFARVKKLIVGQVEHPFNFPLEFCLTKLADHMILLRLFFQKPPLADIVEKIPAKSNQYFGFVGAQMSAFYGMLAAAFPPPCMSVVVLLLKILGNDENSPILVLHVVVVCLEYWLSKVVSGYLIHAHNCQFWHFTHFPTNVLKGFI